MVRNRHEISSGRLGRVVGLLRCSGTVRQVGVTVHATEVDVVVPDRERPDDLGAHWSGSRVRYIKLNRVEALREVDDLSLIHISEPTRLGMISYAVFCLKKK